MRRLTPRQIANTTAATTRRPTVAATKISGSCAASAEQQRDGRRACVHGFITLEFAGSFDESAVDEVMWPMLARLIADVPTS